MKTPSINTYSDHQALSQLLPWFVNKTLQGTELKAVEDHLKVCLICNRELSQLQKLSQLVVNNNSLDSAEQASFSRLKKRLHSNQQADLSARVKQEHINQTKAKNVTPLIINAKQSRWANIAVLRPALAMAAALLLSLSVLMPRHLENGLQTASQFRTLSSDTKLASVNANEIRVVFAEKASQHQKSQILDRIHGQLVDGKPTAQGVYSVRLGRDITEKHIIDVIELLKKDSNVIFAEPAYALLSSKQEE